MAGKAFNEYLHMREAMAFIMSKEFIQNVMEQGGSYEYSENSGGVSINLMIDMKPKKKSESLPIPNKPKP